MKLRLALCAALAGCSSSPAPNDAAVTDAPVTPPSDAPVTSPSDAPVTPPPDVPRTPGMFVAVPYMSAMPERTFAEPAQVLMEARDYRAVVETDAGRIVLDLYEERTPLAVNSFVFLALHHFYEGIAFHRVLDGFVAQAGDPNTLSDTRTRWGSGGPGYGFDTEAVTGLGFDGPGVLGMARSTARDSNGSQFFITLAATTSLNGNYTVFGRVTEGLDVLPRIARNQSMNVPPATPTRIMRVTIEARAR